jgi:Golgi phosphoprotein 3 (GPP34)
MAVATDSRIQPLVAEDLLLVVLNRKAKLARDAEAKLRYAVAAALVAELVLGDQLEVDPSAGSIDRRLVAGKRRQAANDALLDLVAGELPESRWLGETLREMANPDGDPWLEVVAARLEERGMIERRGSRRYHVRDRAEVEELCQRALASLDAGGRGDLRTTVVLRLVHAAGLSKHAFGLKDRLRFDRALVDTRENVPENVRHIADALHAATEHAHGGRVGTTGDIQTDGGGF